MEQIIDYFNGRLSYMLKHYGNKNSRHKIIEKALTRHIEKDTTVLDVGCGIGLLSDYMHSLGAKVTGIDIAPKLIEKAKELHLV